MSKAFNAQRRVIFDHLRRIMPFRYSYVSWPPPGLRTDTKWDGEDCVDRQNLRSVKWGPKGGRWEQRYVPVAAKGPPHEERRQNMGCCWLCNTKLMRHHRKWTRPQWTRRVTHCTYVPLPYEDTRGHDSRNPRRRVSMEIRESTKEEPSSQLEMTIFSCPNGCDADDTLQALLDQTDHTGPERAPKRF